MGTHTDFQKKEISDPNYPTVLKQINRLEKNLTWMGSYLETLSHTYKKQMDDVRTSFERTQSRLTKVEQAQASFAKSLEQMLDMIRHLYTEVYRLDATLEKVILAASLMIGLQIIILLLLCRRGRDSEAFGQRLAEIEVALELLKDATDKAIDQAKNKDLTEEKFRRHSDAAHSRPKNRKLKNRPTATVRRIDEGSNLTKINITNLNVYVSKSASQISI